MKANKRRILCLLLVLLMTVSLCACGQEPEAQPTAADEDAYTGFWQYDDGGAFLYFDGEGGWAAFDSDGTCLARGGYEYDGSGISIPGENEDAGMYFLLQEDGTLIDGAGETLSATTADAVGYLPVQDDYIGDWVDEADGSFLVFEAPDLWELYNAHGDYVGRGRFAYDNGGMQLRDELGQSVARMTLDVTGVMTGDDGRVLQSGARPALPADQRWPAADDPLAKYIFFPGDRNLCVAFPSLFDPLWDNDKQVLFFKPLDAEGAQQHVELSFQLINQNGYDKCMERGSAMAQDAMCYMVGDLLTQIFPGSTYDLSKSDFVDGGTYFACDTTGTESGPLSEQAGEPVGIYLNVRYAGPTGHCLLMVLVAPQSIFSDYQKLAVRMLDTFTYDFGWDTAPKAQPAVKNAGSHQSGTSYYSTQGDPGDYGDTFSWVDEDGDVWYWNGYEDEFIGYGGDYYVEDGQYYESQDAEWMEYYEGQGDYFY